MKLPHLTYRLYYPRVAVAGALVLASVGLALVAAKPSGPATGTQPRRVVFKKSDPDAGMNKAAVFGGNEYRGADYTPSVEAMLQRALPAKEVPMKFTINAQNNWKQLNANKHSVGTWQLIGPSEASAPGVLNGLGDNAPYITAGRVTALALAPNCGQGKCRLYVAAAGGGIWRTDKAMHNNPSQKWEFISASFATNAIGSLIIDPNDRSGNTLFAGTGEPNASGDSEAGLGIYKSTNGGDSWTLLPGSAQFQGRAIGSIATQPDGTILAGVDRAVRGVSSVTGGATSAAPGRVTLGLYRSTDGGATFTLIWDGNGTLRGVNEVRVDPSVPTIIYAAAFQQGIWRSVDNGTTFEQIKLPRDAAFNTDRAEFAVNKLPNGKTRMYTGIGNDSIDPADEAHFWRTDDAQTATDANFVDLTNDQNVNYCGDPAVGAAQCWYDNVVYSPPGFPNVVYLGGSFSYSHLGSLDNGRAWLLSTDGGVTWSDLTQDGDPTHAEFTHPDQHAIVTLPGNPFLYWNGSDGGIVSSDGRFADVSYKCDQRGLSGADLAFCKSMLRRVPNDLANNINKGFSTLQFQSFSVSRQRPSLLQGGTQDNGTWQYNGSPVVWPQIMYGDGGQSGFASTNDQLRFNSFAGQASDVNFRNGDPTKWVIATGKIVSSPEGSQFYPPITADPHPANPKTIFHGSNSVWRTQDWAGDPAFLEANCPEFTTSAADDSCGDFVKIGPPDAWDLTDSGIYNPAPVYGPDRRGNFMAAIERTTGNATTIWAATGAGRVFISDNSNAPANSVVWTRLDNTAANDPPRFPTSIYVDPANANHSWISYSGYNATVAPPGAEPNQPGHVFEITRAGSAATWVDRSYNLPDFPITDLVRDDVTGDLYAASDFGVMKLAKGTTIWVVAGSGLPNVEVPGLTIVPSQRILYAATHGRSGWALKLP